MGSKLAPTEAQLDFVKDICDELNIDEPEEFTREAYSDFISEYKDQMHNTRRIKRYNPNYIFWN